MLLYIIPIIVSILSWGLLINILNAANEIKNKEDWTKAEKLKFKASIAVFVGIALVPYLNIILALAGIILLCFAIFDSDLK